MYEQKVKYILKIKWNKKGFQKIINSINTKLSYNFAGRAKRRS